MEECKNESERKWGQDKERIEKESKGKRMIERNKQSKADTKWKKRPQKKRNLKGEENEKNIKEKARLEWDKEIIKGMRSWTGKNSKFKKKEINERNKREWVKLDKE